MAPPLGPAADPRTARRCSGDTQALVVDPVVRAAQRVLAPCRVVFRREAGALEVVQPAHRQHQPVFALLHHAVEQVHSGHAAALQALDGGQLIWRGAERRLFRIVVAQFGAQASRRLVQLAVTRSTYQAI